MGACLSVGDLTRGQSNPRFSRLRTAIGHFDDASRTDVAATARRRSQLRALHLRGVGFLGSPRFLMRPAVGGASPPGPRQGNRKSRPVVWRR